MSAQTFPAAWLSATDTTAGLRPSLLMQWHRTPRPGLSGRLDLGKRAHGYDGVLMSSLPEVFGVMDDFGDLVITEVRP